MTQKHEADLNDMNFDELDAVEETENALTALSVRMQVLSTEMSADVDYESTDENTGETVVTQGREAIAVEEQQRKADAVRILAEAHRTLAQGMVYMKQAEVELDEDEDENNGVGNGVGIE